MQSFYETLKESNSLYKSGSLTIEMFEKSMHDLFTKTPPVQYRGPIEGIKKSKKMAKEIEFKFLCNDVVLDIIENRTPTFLSQGYLHVDKNQQIRIRLVSDKSKGIKDTAWICVKHMIGDGIERDEFEYEIPYEDGKKMYDKCLYKFLKKRYNHKTAEGYTIDIDYYDDDIITAEVELPTKETLFTKPMYFGEDITGVHKYCNYAYAGIPETAY